MRITQSTLARCAARESWRSPTPAFVLALGLGLAPLSGLAAAINQTTTHVGVGGATQTVTSPPQIVKAFGAATIALGNTTSLTFTLSNPNPAVALTDVAFADSLPAGLVVATPNGSTNTCGGIVAAVAGASFASLSGATLAASASCTVAVNVTATTAGVKNNGVQVTSTNGGVGNTSNAVLTVTALPPTIAQAFGAATVPLNGATPLTFTLLNPNASGSLTGVAFTGTLSLGLEVAAPSGLTNTCGGTATADAGSYQPTLSGATLAAGASCTVTVNVRALMLSAQDSSAEVTSTNGGIGNTSDEPLTVLLCTRSGTIFCTGLEKVSVSPIGSGMAGAAAVVVDANGDVFVSDAGHGAVKKILGPGYTTTIELGSGFWNPNGVALDGGGNVFVADTNNNAVKEILAAGGYTTVITLASGFNQPYGVAVDVFGNVFVADTANDRVQEILAAGGYTTVVTLASGFNQPYGVAVDAAGNVFVADTDNNAVKEILAPGYTTVNTLGFGFSSPNGVAVDARGNVFVADSNHNEVKEILAPGYANVITLGEPYGFPMFDFPAGVSVDGNGDVFVADFNNGNVAVIAQ